MWPFRRLGEQPLGRRGEDIALRHLRRQGARLLARNYRCPDAEVDLIVMDSPAGGDGPTIAFVEVKTRSSDYFTDPVSAVNARKRSQLRKAAQHYLAHHPASDCNVRFDVISVLIRPDGQVKVSHIPEAFQ